jgi:hypothetical protein
VQIVNILSDYFAFEILPRTNANAITRIDSRLAVVGLRAQISVPGLGSSAMSLSQLLAIVIGSLKTTEITPFARPKARYKEGHARRLG